MMQTLQKPTCSASVTTPCLNLHIVKYARVCGAPIWANTCTNGIVLMRRDLRRGFGWCCKIIPPLHRPASFNSAGLSKPTHLEYQDRSVSPNRRACRAYMSPMQRIASPAECNAVPHQLDATQCLAGWLPPGKVHAHRLRPYHERAHGGAGPERCILAQATYLNARFSNVYTRC